MRPTYKKLTNDEINERLKEIDSWHIENGQLNKIFKFESFIEAFGFITKIAIESEKLNHHPELYNVYNKVRISLSTHDVDGLTENDFILAKKIDQLL